MSGRILRASDPKQTNRAPAHSCQSHKMCLSGLYVIIPYLFWFPGRLLPEGNTEFIFQVRRGPEVKLLVWVCAFRLRIPRFDGSHRLFDVRHGSATWWWDELAFQQSPIGYKSLFDKVVNFPPQCYPGGNVSLTWWVFVWVRFTCAIPWSHTETCRAPGQAVRSEEGHRRFEGVARVILMKVLN